MLTRLKTLLNSRNWYHCFVGPCMLRSTSPKRVNLDRTGEDHSAMNFRIAQKAAAASVNFAHQLWQLEDVGRNPASLIAAQELRRRAPSRLILTIDVVLARWRL